MLRRLARDRWPFLAAALCGFGWFIYIGGAPMLNPMNTRQLSGDWMQHWLGFLFFTHEPWTFPLGTLTTIPYPLGSSIGFTDSNPLLAIPLKLLAPYLPREFQVMGLWLALCFALQGYVGAKLTTIVTTNRVQQFLGGCLFALSPVLRERVGHDTLCAHWLILGLLYLGLRPYTDGRGATRAAYLAVGALWVASAIHPYLAAMSAVLVLAFHGRLVADRMLQWRTAVPIVVIAAAGTAAIMGVIGYFSGPSPAIGGFRLFTSDLLAFVDPRDTSRLIPALPSMPAQWEGFGFVGLGGLIAVAVAMGVSWRRRPKLSRGQWIVVGAVVLMAVYSLSSEIRVGGHLIAHARRGYRLLGPVIDIFRASGRFIWPLHYGVILFGVWGISRMNLTRPRPAATLILSLAIAAQVADFRANPYWFSEKPARRPPAEWFALTRGHFDHLALYPPQVGSNCDKPLDEDRVYNYGLLAYRLGLTYNSGTFARVDQNVIERQCEGLPDRLLETDVDARTVYVVAADSVPAFAGVASCNRFAGDWICVSRQADAAFRTLVETGREPGRK